MDPRPTVGRIVHYQSYGTPGGEYPSVPRAAIVTEITEAPAGTPIVNAPHGVVAGLAILNPTGMFFTRGVRYCADGSPGTWRWPPREDPSALQLGAAARALGPGGY